jgi:hypothetical protein
MRDAGITRASTFAPGVAGAGLADAQLAAAEQGLALGGVARPRHSNAAAALPGASQGTVRALRGYVEPHTHQPLASSLLEGLIFRYLMQKKRADRGRLAGQGHT